MKEKKKVMHYIISVIYYFVALLMRYSDGFNETLKTDMEFTKKKSKWKQNKTKHENLFWKTLSINLFFFFHENEKFFGEIL